MKKFVISGAALSAAVMAAAVVSVLISLAFLPEISQTPAAEGVTQALAAGLAVAVAVAALIVFIVVPLAVAVVLCSLSLAVYIRLCRKKPCGRGSAVLLGISLLGVAAAFAGGLMVCWMHVNAAMIFFGCTLIAAAVALGVLNISIIVKIARDISASKVPDRRGQAE